MRLRKVPDERDMNPDRKTALELSIRAYAEKCEGHVINPKIGTEFDSLDEAYEFYNLYSWETGFGIRLAKSRLNRAKNKMYARDCLRMCGTSMEIKPIVNMHPRIIRSVEVDNIFLPCQSLICIQVSCVVPLWK